MFSVLLHRVGRLLPSATPSAFGPRQRSQSRLGSWGNAGEAANTNDTSMSAAHFIPSLPLLPDLGVQRGKDHPPGLSVMDSLPAPPPHADTGPVTPSTERP